MHPEESLTWATCPRKTTGRIKISTTTDRSASRRPRAPIKTVSGRGPAARITRRAAFCTASSRGSALHPRASNARLRASSTIPRRRRLPTTARSTKRNSRLFGGGELRRPARAQQHDHRREQQRDRRQKQERVREGHRLRLL